MTNKGIKLLLFTLSVIFIIITSCNNDRFTIKGTIQGNPKATIYLSEYNLTGERIIDSSATDEDGDFKFKNETKQTDLYRVFINSKNSILVFASPGEKITLKLNENNWLGNYSVEGSKYSEDVKLLNDNLLKTNYKLDSLTTIYLIFKDRKGYDTLLKRLDNEYEQIIKLQRNFSIKFIVEHLASPACIIALYQQFNENTYVLNQNRDLQYLKLVSDTLKKYFPESRVVKALWADRNRLFTEYNRLKFGLKTKELPVHLFPDINLPNAKGDTISLQKVKSKMVLVFFWSPLSNDCMAALTAFNTLYKKYYSKGFEIYNVALIDDVGYWSNMVARLNNSGINVIDAMAERSIFAKIYNVQSVPATYLINTSEGIIARDIFGDKLEILLKKNLH